MQILKVLLESPHPLTSHQLYARVQEQYTTFPTRNSFKAHLKGLWRRKWVAAKAPAAKVAVNRGGHKGKTHKAADVHWLYSPTPVAWKVDLNSRGQPLRALAMQQADEWTRKELPQYANHMREGRVPVTWENLGVLRDVQQREVQYAKHLLVGGGAAAAQQQQQLGAGSAVVGGQVQMRKKKKQK
jgi:hypothetical protein